MKYLHEWQIRITLAGCLNSFAQLQQAYFNCYLKKDYFPGQPTYEKNLYRKRSLSLFRMAKARCLLKRGEISKKWTIFFENIERLSEIIFSLNQLRFRIKDRAIFEICLTEMREIEKASVATLKELAKFILGHKKWVCPIELLDSIHSFEAISRRTLQVVSPEPILFLFFTQDLYVFYDEISRFVECQ